MTSDVSHIKITYLSYLRRSRWRAAPGPQQQLPGSAPAALSVCWSCLSPLQETCLSVCLSACLSVCPTQTHKYYYSTNGSLFLSYFLPEPIDSHCNAFLTITPLNSHRLTTITSLNSHHRLTTITSLNSHRLTTITSLNSHHRLTTITSLNSHHRLTTIASLNSHHIKD